MPLDVVDVPLKCSRSMRCPRGSGSGWRRRHERAGAGRLAGHARACGDLAHCNEGGPSGGGARRMAGALGTRARSCLRGRQVARVRENGPGRTDQVIRGRRATGGGSRTRAREVEEERARIEGLRDHARKRALKGEASADEQRRAKNLGMRPRMNPPTEATYAVQLAELHVPALPRLIADDATVEQWAGLSGSRANALASFEPRAVRCKSWPGEQVKESDLELFCKGYSGDGHAIDRASKPSILLQSPF